MVLLASKSNARYIRHLRVLYESMVEDVIEQLLIHTYIKNLENKKKPARTIKFSKKDDKLMIFFKAP